MKGETMKPAIISLLILGALSASGENLLRNSSFELGSAEYSIAAGIPYSAADFTPGTAECDGSTRIHGKYSLFFPNPNGNVMQFSSHDVTLTPGKRYTFTCQLKSDRPAEVQLLLRSCTYDKKGYHKTARPCSASLRNGNGFLSPCPQFRTEIPSGIWF